MILTKFVLRICENVQKFSIQFHSSNSITICYTHTISKIFSRGNTKGRYFKDVDIETLADQLGIKNLYVWKEASN